MTSSHEQKKTLFFYLSVRQGLFRVLLFHQFGRHWAQNIGFVDHEWIIWLFFRILAGNGRIWRKSEKIGFLVGQKQANMAIFVARPQVSLTISQSSIIFFLLEDMSVICLSLLTNSVGLKDKELQMVSHRWFSVRHSSNQKVIRTLSINYMPVSIFSIFGQEVPFNLLHCPVSSTRRGLATPVSDGLEVSFNLLHCWFRPLAGVGLRLSGTGSL